MTRVRPVRRWRVLAGDRDRALARLGEALAVAPLRCHWFGDRAPPGIRPLSPREATAALGSECDLLVYDAHAGLYPDTLAALLGTLRGGGELVLLTPPWSAWAGFDDPALARLAPWPLDRDAVGRRFIIRMRGLIEAAGPQRIQPAEAPLAFQAPKGEDGPLRLNAAQQDVVAAIERVARGHARRPLVLLADRGRGKSTAIGSALARLLKSGSERILLLAPSRAAVGAVFDQLARELPEGERRGDVFALGKAETHFCLPAHYLGTRPDCDLLVVDEAAALGLPLLQRLCERHNRLVFSTTVHGYEGSGRGFAHRFCAFLGRHYRQWRWLELQEPVRWAPGDPLEALTDRLFLLSADAPSQPPPQAGEGETAGPERYDRGRLRSVPSRWRSRASRDRRRKVRAKTGRVRAAARFQNGAAAQRQRISFRFSAQTNQSVCSVRYRWLDQDALAADEDLLSALYGLLAAAHYQTRPSDLQRLLDGPDVRILAALHDDRPLGVLLAVEEGGMPHDLAEAVCAGKRRPRGHQLVQSLAQHGGWCEAPVLRLWRVMRIAVAGPSRRRGIGSALLACLRDRAATQGIDLLGTSFGLDAALLAFWERNGYSPARLGHRVDPASAARSLQMLHPLSEAGRRLVKAAGARFRRDLPWRLGRDLADLPPEAVAALLRGRDCSDLPLDESDLRMLRRLAAGGRDMVASWPLLWRWAVRRLAAGAQGSEAVALVGLLQGAPFDTAALREGLSGD